MGEALERWLSREGLARRIDVKPHNVARMVKQGKLPRPSYHLGERSPRWDRHAVDALMMKSQGIETKRDMDEILERHCEEKIRQHAALQGRKKAPGRRVN
ncbi:helix-turn-helix transcriptional regulator [Komagataeibacter oboediens]|uniref:helix-turn-helix transcriptional regulator n=1 Tax=Komagataeibacter oboediens TaxID=65958 RepID=UPI000237ECC5|nr:hypothetical protein [Komagataeibacter oboediens]